MAVAPHRLAAEAGRDVLDEGGSAVEAAVAVAACLAVVYPHMTGIGGDAFWLIRDAHGRTTVIDGCGRAAAAATPQAYADLPAVPWRGPRAMLTTAGAVSAWAAALARAPVRLPLARLLRDAVRHAEAGVAVTHGGAQVAAAKGDELRIQPGAYAQVFEPAGAPLREGEHLPQPALARTLRALAEEGLDGFYRGRLAQRIADDLQALGSPLAAGDLAAHTVSTPEPLCVRVAGARLFNTPAPTQGVASLAILALADRLDLGRAERLAHVHGVVEATKRAFLWRDAHLGDPARMTADAQAWLDDAAGLDALAAGIDPRRALAWPSRAPDAGDTTAFAVADAQGAVVSAIQSTYFEFGAGVVLPQTGIVWQNRGAGFRLGGGGPNVLRPGAKPFHTLNPALAVFDDGRVMALGTMGGEGQPQTQAAIYTRYAHFGLDLQAAVDAPRWLLGRTWGEESVTLKLESRFDPAVVAALRAAGHDVELVAPMTAMMGHACALVRHPDGRLEGAADPRSDGAAAGC